MQIAQWSLYVEHTLPRKSANEAQCFRGNAGFLHCKTIIRQRGFKAAYIITQIIGDTIPNVIAAVFPTLPNTPFLWLLTNRRAIIVLCVLCFSYPLSLYRDIAKV